MRDDSLTTHRYLTSCLHLARTLFLFKIMTNKTSSIKLLIRKRGDLILSIVNKKTIPYTIFHTNPVKQQFNLSVFNQNYQILVTRIPRCE